MKQKSNKKWIYGLIALVVLLIFAAVVKSKNKPKGEKVFTEKVARRDILEAVSASGKIFPVTEVKISSDVSGEVVDLFVEEGDSVVAGQLLARIDPDAYQSQVERGHAAVNAAKAQLANARAQVDNLKAQKEQIMAQLINARGIHKRNEQLYKDGVISQAEFESSQSNLKALEANLRSAEASIRSAEESAKAAQFNVQSAEATLKELRTSLRRTSLYAPINGIVSKLNVEKGERVVGTIQMAGTEVMRIANLNAMEIQVEVSENDIPKVAIGNEVSVEVDAYVDRKFKGRVRQIANSSNDLSSAAGGAVSLSTDQVTNFVVTIDVLPDSYKDLITADKPYPFRPGMSASVDIHTRNAEDVLSVSIQAVGAREDEDSGELQEVVFKVQADTVAMIPVKTGVQDDDYIEITEGELKEGDEIVAGPFAA
ncbi:MAG TPA: HlyD family efflux transporter periplasmic adaptor subunit, partial [Phaeodactylibacter sp.]|nr:HlyD family efflux transporter periplasmic adaptor subunit [Phaeodactylibacter sp.]